MAAKKPPTPMVPFCIRFRPKDLDLIRKVADHDGMLPTVWVRDWGLTRVAAIEAGETPEPLRVDHRVDGDGKIGARTEALSVRFNPKDYERVRAAARKEGQIPGPWLRALAIQQAQETERRRRRPASSKALSGAV